MRIKSNDIVLLDVTDTKKVDIHISSNHPTIQIYNSNTTQATFTPDWSDVPLVLEAKIYADSTDITNEIGSAFKWSRKIGDQVDVLSSTTNTLTISENELVPPTVMVQYICSITYNEKSFENMITFARTDVGKDGASGNSAPAVKAQYSIDGTSNWTATLNTSTHKYIRFSYDNGTTWTSAIKIAGEDGKSVQIKGVAYAQITPISGQTITLYSDKSTSTQITNAINGDSYLVDGYLCVYNGTNFVCTGQIQGPQGAKGDSYYLFIRYADNVNGTGISTSPDGKSYIGFYRSSVNQVPTDVSSATWNWAKFVGEDAKSITLSANAQVFKVDKSNIMTPTTITVTAQAINTTIPSSGWTYSTDGGKTFSTTAPTGITRSGNVVTLTGASITSDSIVVKASDGTYSDLLTIYKALDGYDGKPGDEGEPAPIVFLTNENISFAANANGQVPQKTTVVCDVVAYNGTTPVVPSVGTILSSNIPNGMTISKSTISNIVRLTIVVDESATLGSVQSTNGEITVPITSPIPANLQLTWSKINSGEKGDTGVGISSVTVTYGVSTSASTQPTSWQSSVPAVAEGSYLWTRTITDYTDDSIPDTVTYTYAKQGVKGDTGSPGSPVMVSKIEYQAGTSAIVAPTETWSNSVVTVAEGGYLWTKTTFSDGKVAYGVAKQGVKGDKGDKGDAGRGISKITEYYLATTESSGITTATSGWTTTIQTIDATKKYLWNYELVAYTDGTTNSTTPVIIGVFGNTGDAGKGISSVAEHYLATVSSSGVTTSTSGWTSEIQTLTATKKYLWNYEIITYTDGTTSTISPVIIGVYGDKGDDGVGIASTTVTYGESDSSSTQPTSWQATIPTVAEGKYLWTRTVIDYTDTAKADTVSYTYAKQGTKGDQGSAGSSVTVTSIQYQEGSSATTAPTGNWSNSVVSVADGKYLWTKTVFSDGKTAYGVAKQGSSGRGVSSIAEQYYQSTSATTQSGGSWSTTVPTWADGKYIWTRSVITYTDSTTSTTSPVCVTGQKGSIGGTGVGVSSVDVWYYQSTSATALSGGSWSTTSPTWSDGKYVWTKTITTYTDTTTDETAAVCITGQKGSTGVGVKSVTEYYLATASSSGVTTSTSGWTTTVQAITVDKKYLWNYEVITYTNNTTSTTTPVIIGVFGNTGDTGKGIKSVTEYYLATSSSSNVTTSTSGWTTTMQTLTSTKKYLWNYELITYTDNTTTTVSPVIIGVYGDQGVAAVSFQVYAPNGYLLTKELESLTLQTFAYEGSTAITSGATYQWSQLIDETWTAISGATSKTYTVKQADVLKAKSYRCVMTYKSQTYTSTVTVQDKTDSYNSIMCISSNTKGSECYWVLYTIVYSDTEEVDPLLGPISINAPTSPVNGDYWYAIDTTNATVQLKKYNDDSWVDSTEKQLLTYLWNIVDNGSLKTPISGASKVQVISCHDFTATATLICDVSNEANGVLTQSSLSLTDASDPIVSTTEPANAVDGQIWIKPNTNGAYNMFVWSESAKAWIPSDMDTRNKVYTAKPSSYNKGDIWITESDTAHSKYKEGTLLQASKDSTTYSENDWSATLKYDKDIDNIQTTLKGLSEYVTITSQGLRIGAVSSSGELSPFTSLFTSTELAFYQNSEKLLTLANSQLTAPRVVIEEDLEVQGSISLGGLQFTIENNGSFSLVVTK